MSLSDFLFGKDDEMKQISNLSPSMQKYLKQYMQNPIQNTSSYGAGSDYIQKLLSGDPQLMQQFQQPAIDMFNQQTVPGIAERFAGSNAMSSSGLNNALAQAGRGLQTDLAAQRGQLQMQALPQALQYAQQPYSNILGGIGAEKTSNVYQPGNTGFLGNLAQGALTAAGTAFGGPIGAAAGNALGSAMFNKGSTKPAAGGGSGYQGGFGSLPNFQY